MSSFQLGKTTVKIPKSSAVKIENTADGVRFTVKVVPGSNRTALAGVLEGLLKVKIAAPPEKGKANQQLLEYFSRLLGVRKNQITIAAGAASPVKTVHVAAVTAQQVHQAFSQDVQTDE